MASPPFKVKAVFEYSSPHDDDLKFPNGQIITVIEEEDADWYIGEYTDAAGSRQEGLFPKNFVEKYEPAPPPRPVRAPRPKPAEAPAPLPDAPSEPREQLERSAPPPAEPEQPKPKAPQSTSPPAVEDKYERAPAPVPVVSRAPEAQPQPSPAPKPAAVPAAKAPPPVAEKPSSFRDRIAAFNKSQAAPIAPFKPGGASASTFIKKPFVAPPPSRNSFVPQPREAPPQKLYRRDEDPEIAERRAQDEEAAQNAGLAPSAAPGAEEEDAPKPQSLKERIALLQKQQMEQAQKRSEVAHKEKPKRPPKKRTESHEPEVEGDGTTVVEEQGYRGSSDVPRDETRAPPHVPRPPRGPKSPDALPRDREPFSENDADQSAAGETTEEADGNTSVEDEEARVMPPRRSTDKAVAPPPPPQQEEDVGEEEDSTEEDEEMDEEERRQQALRERMAKLSGGMGMAGMFGAPAGMPMASAPPKKKKPSAGPERKSTDDGERPVPQQRIPMIPVPGMGRTMSHESVGTEIAVEKEAEEELMENEYPADEVVDIEDIKKDEPRRSHERGAPPPLPHGEYSHFYLAPLRRKPIGPCSPPPDRKKLRASRLSRLNRGGDTPSLAKEKRFFHRRPSVPQSPVASDRGIPPPIPTGRPSLDSRPPPPATPKAPHALHSPSPGSESDDEMPGGAMETELPVRGAPPLPMGGAPPVPNQRPQQSPSTKRASQFMPDPVSPSSASASSLVENRRASRVPPIPMGAPIMPPAAQSRPPPPPPPTAAPPTRQSTSEMLSKRLLANEGGEGETEYEGDYDTDIASGVKHKDALKSHARESSLDDSTMADDGPQRTPSFPVGFMPPIPSSAAAPRGVPPPLPQQPPPSRKSVDAPRAPPPPVPAGSYGEEDEYDPYRYMGSAAVPRQPPPALPSQPPTSAPRQAPPELPSQPPPLPSQPPPPPRQPPPQHSQYEEEEDSDDDDLYRPQTPDTHPKPLQQNARSALEDDHYRTGASMGLATPDVRASGGAGGRDADGSSHQSVYGAGGINRDGASAARRSTDLPRGSTDGGMASSLDLGKSSRWWTQAQTPPPALANRSDVLLDFQESSSVRHGRNLITKEVSVLYTDFSRSIVTALFDPQSPSDASLSQEHSAPPSMPRQDQLEAAHSAFGTHIAEAVVSKLNTTVPDGSPSGLIHTLLASLPLALPPIGTRVFGAPVYNNLANASVQQHDEIRPGDIVTFRNAKFSGKHGSLHAKYAMDVGKPDHVAIVADWDGTKKKIRAYEQGRESKKVKIESFKLGDLRSGEVRVWRVMPKAWIGWR